MLPCRANRPPSRIICIPDSIHEVGFSGTIGPYHRGEILERADDLSPGIGLEVLRLDSYETPHPLLLSPWWVRVFKLTGVARARCFKFQTAARSSTILVCVSRTVPRFLATTPNPKPSGWHFVDHPPGERKGETARNKSTADTQSGAHEEHLSVERRDKGGGSADVLPALRPPVHLSHTRAALPPHVSTYRYEEYDSLLL